MKPELKAWLGYGRKWEGEFETLACRTWRLPGGKRRGGQCGLSPGFSEDVHTGAAMNLAEAGWGLRTEMMDSLVRQTYGGEGFKGHLL